MREYLKKRREKRPSDDRAVEIANQPRLRAESLMDEFESDELLQVNGKRKTELKEPPPAMKMGWAAEYKCKCCSQKFMSTLEDIPTIACPYCSATAVKLLKPKLKSFNSLFL